MIDKDKIDKLCLWNDRDRKSYWMVLFVFFFLMILGFPSLHNDINNYT